MLVMEVMENGVVWEIGSSGGLFAGLGGGGVSSLNVEDEQCSTVSQALHLAQRQDSRGKQGFAV